MIGHGEQCPAFFFSRKFDAREMFFDELFNLHFVKITDNDNSHQVGAIPPVIKLAKCFVPEFFKDRFFSNWKTLRVSGIFE